MNGYSPPPVAKAERPKPTPAPPERRIKLMFPGFYVLTQAQVDDMCLDENGDTVATRYINEVVRAR